MYTNTVVPIHTVGPGTGPTVLTVDDEFDFPIRVPDSVARRVNSAEVHAVIPPHDLGNGQVCLCKGIATYLNGLCEERIRYSYSLRAPFAG